VSTSPLRVNRGTLIEYGLGMGLLMLDFEFNPSSITRTRNVWVGQSDTGSGYDFLMPSEAQRAAQGVVARPESFSITILLDATDRMEAGEPIASTQGVQPELDVIRSMLEPRSQQPDGAKMLSALTGGAKKSHQEHQVQPVLLFKWGLQSILPVFMTQARIVCKEFLPTLFPYRAEATLTLQVIESNNPFYNAEVVRQNLSALSNVKNNLGT